MRTQKFKTLATLFLFSLTIFVSCKGGGGGGAATNTIAGPNITTSTTNLATNESFTFLTDQDPVTWSVSGGGTIYNNGLYLAPSIASSPKISALNSDGGITSLNLSIKAFSKDNAYQRSANKNSVATEAAGSGLNLMVSSQGKDAFDFLHWIIRRKSSGAWTTSDDYALTFDQNSGANSIISLDGNIFYAGGFANDSSGISHGIIRKFNGTSWTTFDNYQYATSHPTTYNSLYTLATDTIYAVGTGEDSSSVTRWFARYFDGTSWTTIDDYLASGTLSAEAHSIFPLNDNFIAVSGSSNEDNNGYYHWLTRIYQSSAWGTSDDYQLATGHAASANKVVISNESEIYVAGFASDSSDSKHWIVRKYDGSSWTTIDDYQMTSGFHCIAFGLYARTSSEIYVSGSCKDSLSVDHWIIRKWNGYNWSTIDDLTAGGLANFIGSDLDDNLFGVGSLYFNGTSFTSTMIRKFN